MWLTSSVVSFILEIICELLQASSVEAIGVVVLLYYEVFIEGF